MTRSAIASLATFAVLLASAGQSVAQQSGAVRSFFNGNRLLELEKGGNLAYLTAYVVGVLDSTHLVDHYNKGRTVCEPADATQDQLAAVVIKYVTDNPATRHVAAAELVISALKDAFPCARRP